MSACLLAVARIVDSRAATRMLLVRGCISQLTAAAHSTSRGTNFTLRQAYNSFLGALVAPSETIVHVSFSAYAHQVIREAYLWLVSGSLSLYLLLGGLAIWLNRSSMYSDAVIAVLATRTICYLLYPTVDLRYTAVLSIVISVALVIGVLLFPVNRPAVFLQNQTLEPSARPEREGVVLLRACNRWAGFSLRWDCLLTSVPKVYKIYNNFTVYIDQ
jgi:hypothetical protein